MSAYLMSCSSLSIITQTPSKYVRAFIREDMAKEDNKLNVYLELI